MHHHMCRDDKTLRQGRWFLYWGSARSQFSIEFNTLSRKAHWLALKTRVNTGDGGCVGVWLAIPFLFSVWVTLSTQWLWDRQKKMNGSRETGIAVGLSEWDPHVEIDLWVDDGDWSRDMEKRFLGVKYRTGHKGWAHYWFKPVDVLLGHGGADVVGGVTRSLFLKVRMPEGEYHAMIERETRRWKRPRWFAGKPFTTCTVKILKDVGGGDACIPFPGKGENSWDCGMDGLFSSSFRCDEMSDREILDKVQLDVLETRRRRTGNRLWVPKEVEA